LLLSLRFRTDKIFVADASAFAQSRASWGRPMSRLGRQMFFARKRSANEAAAKGFRLCESVAAATAPMLVTKALSQDVMFLTSVPLSLIPKESPSRNEDQLIYKAYVLTNVIYNFW